MFKCWSIEDWSSFFFLFPVKLCIRGLLQIAVHEPRVF